MSKVSDIWTKRHGGEPVARPVATPVVEPRNLDHQEVMLQPSIFVSDELYYKYDNLDDEEREHLDFLRRHGSGEHHSRAIDCLHAHQGSGNPFELDRAISLLLDLRKTQHPEA